MAGTGSLNGSQSDETAQFDSLHIDPMYKAFLCPLSKTVMRDPVSLENGQTFEREAIEKWFKECKERGKKPYCPITSLELKSTELSPSIALRRTIEEWSDRNEVAQLEMARRFLNSELKETDILQALKFVRDICQNSRSNKHAVRNCQMIPMIVDIMLKSTGQVRCKALQTLRVVAEEDEDSKAVLAEGDTVRTIIKFLSHNPSREREEAMYLLFELSKSEVMCEKIGSIHGAIILLIGIATSNSENISIVQKADQTLDNLKKSENNVRQMAINGRLQPLLAALLEGSPETKFSMALCLGDLVLNSDVKVFVAQNVGSSLIDIMKSGNMQSREAALKALNQISSYEGSAKVLIEKGILPPLMKDLFTISPSHPMRLKEVSATILSNIVTAGYDFATIIIGPNHQTLVSEEVVQNLLQLISNTGPAIECKLLQVLVGLTSSPSTVLDVVYAIKSSGAIISLVQFLEASQNDLRLASIKLLHNLSHHMNQELADALRATVGQLGRLIKIIEENTGITEEQAAAAGLLAELPERDLGLTRQLLDQNAFQMIISKVVRIRQREIKGMRFQTTFMEGLLRVLARVTFVLSEEPRAITLCQENNLAELFIDLLQANGQDMIQKVAAMVLENLSLESINLTRIPEPPPPPFCAVIFSCMAKPPVITGLCRIHRGICSLRETFCILEGGAVEKLVALLDHNNEKVVEAALAALSTLLDDNVDLKKGVEILDHTTDGISLILRILMASQTENLKRRSVWVVERILRTEDIAREIADDPNVSSALVDAFQNADYRTKQTAEMALRHIDKIPNFSGIFPNMG